LNTAYTSNIDLTAAAEKLRHPGRRVLLTTHAKPDGDAYGSVVAMTAALRHIGAYTRALLIPPVPGNFQKLRGYDLIEQYQPDLTIAEPDLVVVLDTGAWSQLGPMQPVLKPWLDRMLIVDHHLSGDMEAAWRYIDGEAAACCEIVAQLIDAMGVPYDDTIAEALFVGISSDTGWFRFSNTRPQTHELAARLKRAGVDHAALYAQLEQSERPEKLQLLIRALNSMELLCDGKVAVMTLRARDFTETGAWPEETERFIDVPQAIQTVQMVVLVTEPVAPCNGEQPAVRVSFRSKPGPDAVNVAQVAAQFGGGGHARASGAKVHGPFDQVLQRVRDVVTALPLPGC